MTEAKEIHIETKTDPKTPTNNEDTQSKDNIEKTLVTRLREIAEGALDTIKSDVKKKIEEHVSPIEEAASDVTSAVGKEVAAIIQRVREQYETEREELLRAEIDKQVKAAVQKVEEKHKAERERLLRTAAEAENTKKRLQTEYQRQIQFANETILEAMVPVLDSLEAAIKSGSQHTETTETSHTVTTFNEGVQLVHKQLLDSLKTHGLLPIEAIGETFNPNQHEAILAVPSNQPEGHVVEEFRRGYMLPPRELRASQVVVAQGPPQTENVDTDAPEATDETDAPE